MESKEVMQHFSEGVKKIVNGWEVRVMVLLSLFLQILLIILGSRRKSATNILIRVTVWLAYMSADWVATVSLGNLATSQGDSEKASPKLNNGAIQAFWAPFLLLHLGGPDTITAYSLEDNELWLRHLLGLIVEVAVAIYIFIWSWSKTALTFIAILIFIAGFTKYGERTYVLRSASTKQFKESLIKTNRYAKNAMGLLKAFEEKGFFEGSLPMEDSRKEFLELFSGKKKEKHLLDEAYFLFQRFKYLFANLILGYNEQIECYNIIQKKSPKDAFELVAIELGFMYDVLYTKATITYSRLGIILRAISFFSSVSSLVIFSTIIDMHAYPLIDLYITWLLLIVAVFLEVYAFIILLVSDQTNRWLIEHQVPHKNSLLSSINNHLFHSAFLSNNKRRWSASMAQYNLISYCLKDTKSKFIVIERLPFIGDLFEKYLCLSWESVDGDMKDLIFGMLQEKCEQIKVNYTATNSFKKLLAIRGDYVLKRYGLDEHEWSTVEVEFDQSLLVWHIATDICSYGDFDGADKKISQNCRISKSLSNYMLYLLILYPSRMPDGIGEIRYRDTCAHVKQFSITDRKHFDEKKLKEMISIRPINQSVLSDGCELALKLQSLCDDKEKGWDLERKWKLIAEVWVEMLTYAANRCTWKEHAQQLRRGGELLTHVCLLMAHLGLSENNDEKEFASMLSCL